MNKVLPFLLLLFVFTSCSRKYKIEGASSVTSLDGKMLFLKCFRMASGSILILPKWCMDYFR